MEYLQYTNKAQAHLYWYSADQSRQIIPSSALYPTNSVGGTSNAPSVITSALSTVGFVGQPFSFMVTGANTPLGFTATNLPPGLMFNSTNGLVSGTPLLAGNYQTILTASNLVGIGASVLNILIINNSNSIVREVWLNVPGTNISDIPLTTPATSTNVLGALEGITDFGDNYGERDRGYFTAPVTGNYFFWIAGSDSAQLWISNDGESVNKVLRAYVTPTNNPTASGQNGTSVRQWNLQASQQIQNGSRWSPGQKYYVENPAQSRGRPGSRIGRSAGGRTRPASRKTTRSAGVVPSYLLSRYYPAVAREHFRRALFPRTCSPCPASTAMRSARPRCVSARMARRRF